MASLLIILLVFGTVVFVVLALMAPNSSEIEQRIIAYGGEQKGTPNLAAPFTVRVLMPAVDSIAGLVRQSSPGKLEEGVRRRLEQAGYQPGQNVNVILTLKAAAVLGLPLLVAGGPLLRGQLDLRTILFSVIGAFIGWQLPDLWLSMRIGARQKAIERGLPDAIDLIVVCVEAGNALEAALAQVVRRMRGPLASEFERMLREVALGRTRREALHDLGTRTGVADLQGFIAALLQADQLGVSIAQVLRVQADTMRVRRRQRVEEQAAKLPVKMLFPMVLLIFPALFVVILGPAALSIASFFANGMR